MTRLDRLVEVAKELGDVEMDVLLHVAERIYAGQNAYGKFPAKDPRDMNREAEAEVVDASIYCAVALVKQRKKRGG